MERTARQRISSARAPTVALAGLVALIGPQTATHAQAPTNAATPPTAATPEDSDEARKAALKTAGDLYTQALTRLRRGETKAAIELLEAALGLIPAGDESHRANILYALARAHESAHATSGDVAHLEQALHWLDEYALQLDPRDRDSQDTVARHRATIAAKLEAVKPPEPPEPDPNQTTPENGSGTPPPEPPPEVTLTPLPGTTGPTRPGIEDQLNDRRARETRARRLTIAGATLTGLGGIGTIAMVIGMVVGVQADKNGTAAQMQPDSPAQPGELQRLKSLGVNANTAAYVGAIAGGVLLVTGIPLLVSGRLERSRVELAPAIGARMNGVVASVRF